MSPEERQLAERRERLMLAITSVPGPPPSPEWIDDVLHNRPHQDEVVDPEDPFLDWAELFSEEEPETQWLYEGVLAEGRSHVIYASHKQGKSLFTLWLCAELATTQGDVDVFYLDYEMTRADVRERLEDMGYGAESDLSRLHYALLPSLPPLDKPEGGEALLDLIGRAAREGARVLVVVDTTSRAVAGKENDSDTFRAFYRCTGVRLKQQGYTWGRLDHAGKDQSRGQRGSSSKGDDVDVVWKLSRGDSGVTLTREVSRMSWVDDKVSFALRRDPVRYERTGEVWSAGTRDLAAQLDRLGVEQGAGRDRVRAALREAGIPASTNLMRDAIRLRKGRSLPDYHPSNLTSPDEVRSDSPAEVRDEVSWDNGARDLGGQVGGQVRSGTGGDLTSDPPPRGGQGSTGVECNGCGTTLTREADLLATRCARCRLPQTNGQHGE